MVENLAIRILVSVNLTKLTPWRHEIEIAAMARQSIQPSQLSILTQDLNEDLEAASRNFESKNW